ncbi:MAG: 3D domain-containing protein [Clostridia bacterium]|nr:3D domain-containing protein [Clostridia bacterium]
MLKKWKLLTLLTCGALLLNSKFNNNITVKPDIKMSRLEVTMQPINSVPVTTASPSPSAIVSTPLELMTATVLSAAAISSEETYMYTNGYVYVRDNKNKNAAKNFLLYPGKKVEVVKTYKKWVEIECKYGTGYVLRKNLSREKKEALKEADGKAENFKITGYDSCEGCCGVGGGKITKSGRPPIVEHTIAADLSVLPMYTEVYIEGLGIYTVEDIGGGVDGKHIDVYCNNHEECYDITRAEAKVFVIE